VAEAERLFAQGVREINLIGQDTTCYGEDLGLRDGLPLLLERLARLETPSEKWIRFLYAYPNKVSGKLLDTIAAWPALVKYIDLPLQHSSARVLKRMRRGANGGVFLRLIERIRARIPGVAIRTSMIVGFPGETDADSRSCASLSKRRNSTGWASSPTPTRKPAPATTWTPKWTAGRSTIGDGGLWRSSEKSPGGETGP